MSSHLCLGLPSHFRFTDQSLLHSSYMLRPSHNLFNYPNNIRPREQTTKAPHYVIFTFFLLHPNSLNVWPSFRVRYQVSHSHKTSRIAVFNILILRSLDRTWGNNTFWADIFLNETALYFIWNSISKFYCHFQVHELEHIFKETRTG